MNQEWRKGNQQGGCGNNPDLKNRFERHSGDISNSWHAEARSGEGSEMQGRVTKREKS